MNESKHDETIKLFLSLDKKTKTDLISLLKSLQEMTANQGQTSENR